MSEHNRTRNYVKGINISYARTLEYIWDIVHACYVSYVSSAIEEALTQSTKTEGGQSTAVASPQPTFLFPCSFDPPDGTVVAKASKDKDVAYQHRFEHHPIESSVDPDNICNS